MNDGGKGENHSIRGLLPVSYNLFIRNNINYKIIKYREDDYKSSNEETNV